MDGCSCKYAQQRIENIGTPWAPDKRPFVACLLAEAMRPGDRAGHAAKIGAAGCKMFTVLNTARCPIAQAGHNLWGQCHLRVE